MSDDAGPPSSIVNVTDRSHRTVRAWDKRSEVTAGRLLTHFLGGSFERVDPGGGAESIHDLDVTLPDGRTVAVEVTQSVDSSETAALAAIQRTNWSAPGLLCSWLVYHDPAPNVRNLNGRIRAVLARLEALGCDTCTVASAGPDPEAVALGELGVRSVQAIDSHGTVPQLVLVRRPEVGTPDPDALAAEAARLAALEDNRLKLLKAHRDESHLFVWVGDHFGTLHQAVTGAAMPVQVPVLPPGTDVVWLAHAANPASTWSVSPEGWVHHGKFWGP